MQEHAAFEAERAPMLELFPGLEHRFQEGVREGRPGSTPTVASDTPLSNIASSVAENGCTLFQLQALQRTTASIPADDVGTVADERARRRS